MFSFELNLKIICFVTSVNPFMMCGNDSELSIGAGVFSFGNQTGTLANWISFR